MPRWTAVVHPVVGNAANRMQHRELAAQTQSGEDYTMNTKTVSTLAGLLLAVCCAAYSAEPEARPEPNLKVEADDAEPVKCFKVAWENEANGGMGLPMGQAVELCGGTRSAKDTLVCFAKAYTHPGNDGLGLTLGNAVRLCRTNLARE